MVCSCCKGASSVSDGYEMGSTKERSGDDVSMESKSSADDLGSYVKNKSHTTILNRLKSMQLGETSRSPNDEKRTIFYSLLKNATNGDQILMQRLDDCVSATKEDENDPECAIKVDLTPLLEGENHHQVEIIKDMLDFKSIDSARDLLLHPVIRTFLELKWIKIRGFFFINFLAYLLFLGSYSFYLANIFYRQHVDKTIKITNFIIGDRIVFPSEQVEVHTTKEVKKPTNMSTVGKPLFESCLAYQPNLTCVAEFVVFFSIVILALQEFLQMYALGPRRYFREFENLLEILVLTLASLGLAYQNDLMVLKWISAFGICLAYLELIFLMGRYPFLGGSLSLMFYSIIRHLIKSLSNFLMLIIGFAFGFFIIHHQKESENFENPWKAIAKTLTMVLGEFDFNDLYSAHEDDVYSRSFTMFLLVGLAIMGSLVLVNLIVALIVSDIGMLHKEALLQELINKAQHIVYIESVYSYIFCCCSGLRNRIRISNCVFVCGHNLCHCPVKSLKKDIVSGLKQILRRKQVTEAIEKILTCKSAEEVTSTNRLIALILNILKAKGLLQKSSGGKTASSRVLNDLLESALEIN